jgi:hypothetical protein
MDCNRVQSTSIDNATRENEMNQIEFLDNAIQQIRGMSDDMNLCLRILELRDEIRPLEAQIAFLQWVNEEYIKVRGRQIDPATGFVWPRLATNTAKIIRLQSYLIPLQRQLYNFEQMQKEES